MFAARRTPVSWPYVVGVVPTLADCFQTRAAVDELRAVVGHSGGTAILTTSHTGLLSGMGGVGKTQLAAQLATRLLSEGRLDLLVWITATSRQAILERYAQAAVDLAVPGADGRNVERDAERFHAWLTTAGCRWLVVLDDVTEAAHLRGLWPPATPTGRAVVTTRLRSAALSGAGRHLIRVGGFGEDEAEAYVRARLREHPQLADDPAGLAEDLGYLPLALSQATAFMLNEEIACSEYRQRLVDRWHRLDDLVPSPEELPDDYQRTIAAALSLSEEAADQARPTGLATPLLRLTSVLDPAGIPSTVFTSAAARRWIASELTSPGRAVNPNGTDAHGSASEVEVDLVRSGLRVLHRFNLATVDDGTVRVHGLVQRTIRDRLDDAQLGTIVTAAADALVETWPSIESNRTLCQVLRTNTEVLHQHGQGALLTPDVHPVLFTSINSRGVWGDPTGAANELQQLLHDRMRILGPDHPDTLTTRRALAYWQREAGES